MNDHNLDDLIIDNINTKSSKSKSILTIIALAIVVLIIAIILTKTLLKEPNDTLAITEDTNTEMISPDLTLKNVIKKEVTQEKLSLDIDSDLKSQTTKPLETKATSQKDSVAKTETINSTIKEPVKEKTITIEETKPKTVAISQDIFEEEEDTEAEIKAKAKAKKLALAKEKKRKLEAQKKAKQKALASKIKLSEKTKQRSKPKKPSTTTQGSGRYYIQVGSFRQSPSKQFLSIIKKSGFNYRITSPSSSGTKKLLIGPYASRNSVNSALPRVRDRINKGAFVVKK